jgi:uncharacterized membrane protein HdeD (DUF308 family)
MSTPAAAPDFGPSAAGLSDAAETMRSAANLWWLWIVTGVTWIVASLIILQFERPSITTVGVIVGVMFLALALQQFVVAAMAESMRWLWVVFGLLFGAAGVVALVNPADTFAGLADILGFIFLTVGVWWTIRAFLEKEGYALWWVTLISGILMIVMAFWTSGQLFIEKAYTLLVFAGVLAMAHGIGDIVRGFNIRAMRDGV